MTLSQVTPSHSQVTLSHSQVTLSQMTTGA
jgi:hypothetical protein